MLRKRNGCALPTLSEKEQLILFLLGKKEQYGLRLVDSSKGQLKRGTIYVTLQRMEKEKGYVKSRLMQRSAHMSGPQRRLYRATDLGRRALAAWKSANDTFFFRRNA